MEQNRMKWNGMQSLAVGHYYNVLSYGVRHGNEERITFKKL